MIRVTVKETAEKVEGKPLHLVPAGLYRPEEIRTESERYLYWLVVGGHFIQINDGEVKNIQLLSSYSSREVVPVKNAEITIKAS